MEERSLHPRRVEPLLLVFVFVIGAGLRCAWIVSQPEESSGESQLAFADERDYWRMGERFVAGQVMRDEMGLAAGRMPGYPIFLSCWMWSDSAVRLAQLAQALAGGAGCVLFAAIGARVGGRGTGFAAGMLAALDPFAVLFAGLLLSETLFAVALGAFVLATLVLAGRSDHASGHSAGSVALWGWASWGLCALVCVYLHPSAVLLGMVYGGVLIAREPGWRKLACLGLGVLVFAAGLAPWTVRNYRVLGGFCPLTTRLGISLYDGVGPKATGRSDLGYTRDLPEVASLDELAWNRWFVDRSLEQVRSDPVRVVALAGRKLLATWNIFPNIEEHRTVGRMAISAVWMVAVLLFGAVGLLSVRRADGVRLILLLPVVYFTLLHMVFVGSVRYRIPIMPLVEVFAAAGLVHVVGRIRRRRKKAICT